MHAEVVKSVLAVAKVIREEITRLELEIPPDEGLPAKGQMIMSRALTKGTPFYVVRIAEQINSSYENGTFDACAVMMRRLIETLLLAAFEYHGLDAKIKDPTGEFFQLGPIIQLALAEKWNLSRNTKRALPTLKDLGDKSAHSRRFLAHRDDIDRVRDGFRTAVQELIAIAGLK
ncbi:MAG TPA: hypothetical protein VJ183_20285 [Chloroflexia bacterium]|nr:hypothetical protein [Chloroflexia bacterium]